MTPKALLVTGGGRGIGAAVGRAGHAGEMAAVIPSLLFDAPSFVTGSVLNVLGAR
jgi:NAD(P)-dependent dehydrogenase (short-subunit alcohol dehydrogenase family)